MCLVCLICGNADGIRRAIALVAGGDMLTTQRERERERERELH